MISQSVINEFLAVPQGTTDENEWERAFEYVLPLRRRLGCKTSDKKIISTSSESKEMLTIHYHQARPPKKNKNAVDFVSSSRLSETEYLRCSSRLNRV
jgi:hypothetical protein